MISEPSGEECPNSGFRFFTLNRPIWINVNAKEAFKDGGETGILPITIDGRKVTCEKTVLEHRHSAFAMYEPESTDESGTHVLFIPGNIGVLSSFYHSKKIPEGLLALVGKMPSDEFECVLEQDCQEWTAEIFTSDFCGVHLSSKHTNGHSVAWTWATWARLGRRSTSSTTRSLENI